MKWRIAGRIGETYAAIRLRSRPPLEWKWGPRSLQQGETGVAGTLAQNGREAIVSSLSQDVS